MSFPVILLPAVTGAGNIGTDATRHLQSKKLVPATGEGLPVIDLDMKASTERSVIRWLHILLSIPVIGYFYGPVASIPQAAFATKYIFLPVIVLSGFWLWKGRRIKVWMRRTNHR
jgi:hypothetical protein